MNIQISGKNIPDSVNNGKGPETEECLVKYKKTTGKGHISDSKDLAFTVSETGNQWRV